MLTIDDAHAACEKSAHDRSTSAAEEVDEADRRWVTILNLSRILIKFYIW